MTKCAWYLEQLLNAVRTSVAPECRLQVWVLEQYWHAQHFVFLSQQTRNTHWHIYVNICQCARQVVGKSISQKHLKGMKESEFRWVSVVSSRWLVCFRTFRATDPWSAPTTIVAPTLSKMGTHTFQPNPKFCCVHTIVSKIIQCVGTQLVWPSLFVSVDFVVSGSFSFTSHVARPRIA